MAGSWNKLKKSLSLKLSSHSVPSLPRSPDIPRNDVVRSPSSRSSSSSSSTSRFSRSFSTRSSKDLLGVFNSGSSMFAGNSLRQYCRRDEFSRRDVWSQLVSTAPVVSSKTGHYLLCYGTES
ncbi:hypothetical protein CK203_039759 [Vitis vinifera]|uniref:Uncharacterized protein n=1 Tax=Vitis vinifera TaxID=29760 RepID=A0A438HTW0_VITVI|nr:hypothetical protein CK203_039759 [Vitis vinifera]